MYSRVVLWTICVTSFQTRRHYRNTDRYISIEPPYVLITFTGSRLDTQRRICKSVLNFSHEAKKFFRVGLKGEDERAWLQFVSARVVLTLFTFICGKCCSWEKIATRRAMAWAIFFPESSQDRTDWTWFRIMMWPLISFGLVPLLFYSVLTALCNRISLIPWFFSFLVWESWV